VAMDKKDIPRTMKKYKKYKSFLINFIIKDGTFFKKIRLDNVNFIYKDRGCLFAAFGIKRHIQGVQKRAGDD
jgi:hypothetical protein